ncbi:MAG TPA: hypothetical protein VMV32_10665 [Ignavibacteriaceae bacterium]|nr:hypothetical protein [Ignavibacteriaceae bacterium]
MNEIILNIYLIINNGYVESFRAVGYEMEGGDDNKIHFLKIKAVEDFSKAFHFDAPKNKKGKFMKYPKFAKLEKQGMQYQLFEEIFEKFEVPQNPLVCVTPVVDGKILAEV